MTVFTAVAVAAVAATGASAVTFGVITSHLAQEQAPQVSKVPAEPIAEPNSSEASQPADAESPDADTAPDQSTTIDDVRIEDDPSFGGYVAYHDYSIPGGPVAGSSATAVAVNEVTIVNTTPTAPAPAPSPAPPPVVSTPSPSPERVENPAWWNWDVYERPDWEFCVYAAENGYDNPQLEGEPGPPLDPIAQCGTRPVEPPKYL